MTPDLELSIPLHNRPPQRIPWPKQIKARPQIQRAFDTWYVSVSCKRCSAAILPIRNGM